MTMAIIEALKVAGKQINSRSKFLEHNGFLVEARGGVVQEIYNHKGEPASDIGAATLIAHLEANGISLPVNNDIKDLNSFELRLLETLDENPELNELILKTRKRRRNVTLKSSIGNLHYIKVGSAVRFLALEAEGRVEFARVYTEEDQLSEETVKNTFKENMDFMDLYVKIGFLVDEPMRGTKLEGYALAHGIDRMGLKNKIPPISIEDSEFDVAYNRMLYFCEAR